MRLQTKNGETILAVEVKGKAYIKFLNSNILNILPYGINTAIEFMKKVGII